MKIGKYTIKDFKCGYYWISQEGGEGMAVSVEKLEKLIADFYNKEF
jgi:hypothetical protein